MAEILIIDDEDVFREDLAELLRDAGFTVATAPDAERGLSLAHEVAPTLVLCDVVMPGWSGLELLERCARELPRTSIMLLTAHGQMDAAIQAFRRGACDYIVKPVEPDELIQKCRKLVERVRPHVEVESLRRELSRSEAIPGMIGESPAMLRLQRSIRDIGATSSNVLITGESGVGKELVARALHDHSGVKDGPFIAVNCAAFSETLLESQLFGHLRGAFTGAIRNQPGFFEAARGGTLFLDEISEMPLALQPKLLRAIEQREVIPVGATRPVPIQARFVASTNRKLKDECAAGRFRGDLYFRIRVIELEVPPLRDRLDDIPLLVHSFIQRFGAGLGRRVSGVDREALARLKAHLWPGNVRELQNTIERSMVAVRGEVITAADLPPDVGGGDGTQRRPDDLRQAVRSYEAAHIRGVLREAAGNREEAARRLCINPSTLYRKMAELGLHEDERKG